MTVERGSEFGSDENKERILMLEEAETALASVLTLVDLASLYDTFCFLFFYFRINWELELL